MSTTCLFLPLDKAMAIGIDRLNVILAEAAQAADGELIDDSESMGEWEMFEFTGLDKAMLAALASMVLSNDLGYFVVTEEP